MNALLNFAELAALACWLGSLVACTFFVRPVPRLYAFHAACLSIAAGVQMARGVLWYWGGMIKPSILLFTLLALMSLRAWRQPPPRVWLHHGFTLLLGALYLVWMATRGY